jgi:hypothetical protein
MAKLAIVAGVKLYMYSNDRAPPHFHALYAEHHAVLDLEDFAMIRGHLPRATCEEDRVKKLPRIVSAEPVIHGVLKLVFTDGYEGVVDLRPIIARGKLFTWLQKPKNFQKVQLEEYGHHVFWLDNKGQEIDLGADGLRRDAEKQAEIHKVIAS